MGKTYRHAKVNSGRGARRHKMREVTAAELAQEARDYRLETRSADVSHQFDASGNPVGFEG